MTGFDWGAATERDRDAEVAVRVMGFRWITGFCGYPTRMLMPEWEAKHYPAATGDEREGLVVYSRVPRFTTDPGADFEVLRRVRDTFDESARWRFIDALADLLKIADTTYTTYGTLSLAFLGNGDATGYTVGMYSKAAYLALAVSGERRA